MTGFDIADLITRSINDPAVEPGSNPCIVDCQGILEQLEPASITTCSRSDGIQSSYIGLVMDGDTGSGQDILISNFRS